MKYLDELLISWQILVKAAVEWRSTEPAQVIRNLGTKTTSASECVSFDPSGGALGSWFQLEVWSSRIHHNWN